MEIVIPSINAGKFALAPFPPLQILSQAFANLIISERIVRFRLTEKYLKICHHDLNKCGWLHQWGALMGIGERKDHADGGEWLFILCEFGHLLAEVSLLRLVCWWWWVVCVCGAVGLHC